MRAGKVESAGSQVAQVRVDVRGERHDIEVIDSVLPAKRPANCQHGRRSHAGTPNTRIHTGNHQYMVNKPKIIKLVTCWECNAALGPVRRARAQPKHTECASTSAW